MWQKWYLDQGHVQEVRLGPGIQAREAGISVINKAIGRFGAESSQCKPFQSQTIPGYLSLKEI